jgi:hypothetical protein
MTGTVAYDRSRLGNNGIFTNGPRRKIGKIGQALQFDGVNDYIDLPAGSFDSMLNNSSHSVSAWVKLNPSFIASEVYIRAVPQ